MLNRRYLRIKAMQALYGYFQSGDNDMPRGERELLRSVDRTYELYIYLLLVFGELHRYATNLMEDNRNKHLPTADDLNPSMRFVNNKVVAQLNAHPGLRREAESRKLGWQRDEDMELARKIWGKVKAWDGYKIYMTSPEGDYNADAMFLLDIFKRFIADDDEVEHYLEEQSMHWPGDLNMAVAPALIRTIESGREDKNPELAPLFKDTDEDRRFVIDLYRKTIIENENYEKRIAEKTTNWEVDRIALMDVILMKMAMVELQFFQSIPVKVTLNEYIEVSKTYSTPRSKQFINGILDKLVADFKAEGKLVKTGRGLME
ncbi:MAG: transcription antitermination factor NusB [Bacteroidia bacterium]|jgi:N utilization substance protein B|nr:transcription antitermination factor NusB [Bacteroidia bacterium]